MTKQLNIFYEAERERLYAGLKQKHQRENRAFLSSKYESISILIK